MLAYLLALLPSFLHVPVRKLQGARIAKGARIRFGTILRSEKIELGPGACLGPFAYIRAKQLTVGAHSRIKALTLSFAHTIELGKYVQIAPSAVIKGSLLPKSRIRIGDHSRIFPFCWLEPGEGIEIGRHVGIGGHGLIFTHGAWPDYLKGGPNAYGPVVIEDEVWLPWRVFIMPNVRIGKRSIIGAGSVVTKSLPENVLAAGTPAKVIQQNTQTEPAPEQKRERLQHILAAFREQYPASAGFRISVDTTDRLEKGDLLFALETKPAAETLETCRSRGISVLDYPGETIHLSSNQPGLKEFIDFLRKYGIRLDIQTGLG